MSSIDKKAFGISDSLINAVNEALKGGQVKLDKNHNGKIDGQDFKMLRKEEVVDEGNPANKEKKNAAAASVGAKNRDGQYLSKMNPSVADKIRGREKMSGNDRQQHEEVVDEGNPMNKEKKNAAVAAVGAKNKDSQYLSRMNPNVADKIRGREKMSGKDRQQHEEVQVDEAGMPASVIKSKQNRANMTDKQFADSHKNHSDADLRSMAWRHGLGKPGTPGHDHYVNKRNKGLKEDVEQVDELSTDTYHSAAQKAAKRAMGDVQGRSGPIFKKYAGMANKFRAKGMEQEKKEKAMKEEVDLDWKKDSAAVRASKDPKFVDKMINKWGQRGNAWLNHPALTSKKKKAMKEETDPGFVAEADNAVAKQIAAKKDAFKTQLQQKIAAKQMNTMQAKANKRLSSINASNDKCSCQEGKGKSMTCEMHGDNSKGIKGGKEPIDINPAMREAAELPKKVVTKGHEIAKSIIKNRAGVDNPYAVGMAQAKKSAKMNAYRTDRDKNKED
jgi:hypothetical protein